jgi:hypothetical protein
MELELLWAELAGLDIPEEAWPRDLPPGDKSYTLYMPNGSKVEVHHKMKSRKFYVKQGPAGLVLSNAPLRGSTLAGC